MGKHFDTPTKSRIRGVVEYAEYAGSHYEKADLFKFYGVPVGTGHRIIQDAHRHDLDRCPHHQVHSISTAGAKRKLGDTDLEKCEDLLEKEGISARRMTWAGIANEAGISQDVSNRTVKRAIYKRGYGDFIAAETDYVDEKLAARRVEFTKKMLAERPRPEDWHDVRFSDKVYFCYGPEGKVYIKRKRGERYRIDCLVEKLPKEVQKRLHAWAAISYNFKSDLV